MEPISHFFYSDRLKLQLWDFGSQNKPPLILVHGGLDLRGHGNSAWAPGALYSVAEHVLDLSVLVDIIRRSLNYLQPMPIIGHSLGAITTLFYAGVFPENVSKLVAIEGVGLPIQETRYSAPERIRRWIDRVRAAETRTQHSYPNLAAAVARMKEANPFLSDQVAEHLTLHGNNWNADGSIVWKFDNYARVFPPYGANLEEAAEVFGKIACPALLFWGRQSFAKDPDTDPLAAKIAHRRVVKIDQAGHWLHHDQLAVFLNETKKFLAE